MPDELWRLISPIGIVALEFLGEVYAQRSTHSVEKLDNANVTIPEVSKELTR